MVVVAAQRAPRLWRGADSAPPEDWRTARLKQLDDPVGRGHRQRTSPRWFADAGTERGTSGGSTGKKSSKNLVGELSAGRSAPLGENCDFLRACEVLRKRLDFANWSIRANTSPCALSLVHQLSSLEYAVFPREKPKKSSASETSERFRTATARRSLDSDRALSGAVCAS